MASIGLPATDVGVMTGLTARRVRMAVGALWLLDAALQAQPHLFSAESWRHDVAQSVMGQPGTVSRAILAAISVVAAHATLWNSVFVAVEATLGLLLLSGRWEKAAIAASIPWALGVWWIGEGFGALPTGFALFAAGAPGPVLYYPILGLLAWPRNGASTSAPIPEVPAVATWAALWAGGALLELTSRFGAARVFEANIEQNSLEQPSWSAAPAHGAYQLVAAHPLLIPLLAGLAQLSVAAGVIHPATRRMSVRVGIGLTLVFWVAVQDLGGIAAGGGTDPGAAPLVILLALSLWPLTRTVARTDERTVRMPVTRVGRAWAASRVAALNDRHIDADIVGIRRFVGSRDGRRSALPVSDRALRGDPLPGGVEPGGARGLSRAGRGA